MKKFLFSFVAVLAFTGMFGLQDSFAQSCEPMSEGAPFACSGGTFYGTELNIFCWLTALRAGVCGLADCGTTWTFIRIPYEEEITVHKACPTVE